MSKEKECTYSSVNSYSTLNKRTDKTKNVWFVFHGMGYLSRYFLNYFKHLNREENYIIAPQAPSKYYQDDRFKHVGASWLTREERDRSMQNNLNYLNAVFEGELGTVDLSNLRFIVLGYSQGVSVALRWIASRNISCDDLVIHSGGLPEELEKSQFEHLQNASIHQVFGDSDHYISPSRLDLEQKKSKALFGDQVTQVVFKGGHEVNTSFIEQLSSIK
ncbi:alpha/beta hydrolase [Croceiramulus getboli]|nr:esterase [Flavobacteriaceae bacterium YJPT1-3]